jgi:hypothetical protein
MKWHPISTAPKDGTIILGCQGEGEDYSVFEMMWENNNRWYDPKWDGTYRPTHWCHRPRPPLSDRPYNYRGVYKEHVPTILRMHREGKSTSEILAVVHTPDIGRLYPNTDKILYILRRSGCDIPKAPNVHNHKKTRNAAIVADRLAGKTFTAIAAQHNISVTRTREIFHENRPRDEEEEWDCSTNGHADPDNSGSCIHCGWPDNDNT